MEEKNINKLIEATYYPRTMAAIALGMLALFLLFAAVSEFKGIAYVGSGVQATDTITVSGRGEVFATPDIATFTYTVQSTAADVATAQQSATTKGNAIITYLQGQSIASADIQTTDYEINPQYQYQNAVCPTIAPEPMTVSGSSGGAVSSIAYCPPDKQTLTGYQVSQTVSVKVRDTSKVGTILAGIGSKGATDVSSLSFTFDNPEQVQEQARDKAVADAQANAQELAKSLGVHIVRVVSFNENSGGVAPEPMAYAVNASASGASSAPEIQTGQNDITDNVTITYEIQ